MSAAFIKGVGTTSPRPRHIRKFHAVKLVTTRRPGAARRGKSRTELKKAATSCSRTNAISRWSRRRTRLAPKTNSRPHAPTTCA